LKFNTVDIPRGALRAGQLDPEQLLDLTIVLAQKGPLPPLHVARPIESQPSGRTKFLSHTELQQAHGAVAHSVETVTEFANRHKLSLVEIAANRRSIRLSGKAAIIERAFKTKLEQFHHKEGTFFAPSQPLDLPDEWNGIVEVVLGLHNVPRAHPRRRSSLCCLEPSTQLHGLANAYQFPKSLDGTGQTIGLIELGGGFYPEDIEEFCRRLGIRAPKITVVQVGSAGNQPANRQSVHHFLDALSGSISLAAGDLESDSFAAAQYTAEVTMDLEILAALAPGSHIVVYFASSDEQGLYHAINYAVHDEKNKPDVLSLSWGLPEHTVSEAEVHALERVLHEAAHLGISICASTGDDGAMNRSDDHTPSVNYPASSPYCLACGGTSGGIPEIDLDQEVVWNATHFGIKGASGGGVSTRFPIPVWQQNAQVPAAPGGTSGRGIPDVAGLADPRFGCELLLAGRTFASAGTSAVAPMWAALIARINQALGSRSGHLHPHLYALAQQSLKGLRPVMKGNNGYYHAGHGWNACTGYGTPRGDALIEYLRSLYAR
jgi:kumamolisin